MGVRSIFPTSWLPHNPYFKFVQCQKPHNRCNIDRLHTSPCAHNSFIERLPIPRNTLRISSSKMRSTNNQFLWNVLFIRFLGAATLIAIWYIYGPWMTLNDSELCCLGASLMVSMTVAAGACRSNWGKAFTEKPTNTWALGSALMVPTSRIGVRWHTRRFVNQLCNHCVVNCKNAIPRDDKKV